MGIETAYTISEKGPQMTGYVINTYSGERKSKYSLEDSVKGAFRHVITAPIFRKHDFQSDQGLNSLTIPNPLTIYTAENNMKTLQSSQIYQQRCESWFRSSGKGAFIQNQ